MTTLPTASGPDCLLCAVRELTEGTPEVWNNPERLVPGQTVMGVVLRAGKLNSEFKDRSPFLDLWTGGWDRVRVIGYGRSLERVIESLEAAVGDRVTITYVGRSIVERGPHEGRPVHNFRGEVARGHH